MKLQTLVFDERQADEFVSTSHPGLSARWNGWTLETFISNPAAEYVPRGSYDRETGKWGYTYSFRPNSKGRWIVKIPAEGMQA